MSERVVCDLCGQDVPAHGFYIVQVEVYADPSVPHIDTESLGDEGAAMAELMDELKKYTSEELQDQVHRRFDYRICRGCQRDFIANPLGKPRGLKGAGKN